MNFKGSLQIWESELETILAIVELIKPTLYAVTFTNDTVVIGAWGATWDVSWPDDEDIFNKIKIIKICPEVNGNPTYGTMLFKFVGDDECM